ncbi:hypothetical protein JM946_22340 [Steroidobacter sp. S1-65]|uniref:Uncharacterized protein n=1 Tax=Steroidobacter gossypii TaxID=2805490 RepID=A0ABS1X2P1_9GAMM|nr:hypothetical protein [Steroidobacter gossypii]MBM0107490.1 hypothetical protein [Steroidobacter gossypii]
MSDLVAYIQKNRMEVTNLKDGATAAGTAAFTTTRLLVGEFKAAEELLTRLVKEVKSNGLFSAQPALLIQPLEMIEGGLSTVEERVFLELGAGAGARQVKLHVGPKLDQQAAIALIRARGT